MLELLLSGGATGILGSLFTSVMGVVKMWQEREDKKLQYAHEVRLQEMQLESMKAETERELLIAEQHASSAAMTASIQHDSGLEGVSGWVKDFRASFRPFATLFLMVLTALIFFSTDDVTLRHMVTEAVIFCTIAAISWWFGSRGIEKMVKPKLPWQ